MPTKWFQERADGSKNGHGIGFEGPGVVTFDAGPEKALEPHVV